MATARRPVRSVIIAEHVKIVAFLQVNNRVQVPSSNSLSGHCLCFDLTTDAFGGAWSIDSSDAESCASWDVITVDILNNCLRHRLRPFIFIW